MYFPAEPLEFKPQAGQTLETLATIISIPTILFLIMPELPASTMAATGLCMLITFACLCYAFARINQLPTLAWMLGGFFFGTFALGAIFFVLDQRGQSLEPRPPAPP